MLTKSVVGCAAVGVCLLWGCSDGGKTIYIINAGGFGGAQTSGGAAQGGSATSGGNGTGGTSQGGTNPGTGGMGSGGDAGSSSGGVSFGGDVGAGGSVGTGGSVGAGGSGGQCNALPPGNPVVETTTTGTPPAMTGGMIYDGTYTYAQRLDYVGSCDCSHTDAFVISGGGTQFQENYDGLTKSGTLVASGTTLTFNYSCPAGDAPYSVEYTASDTELQFWTASDDRWDLFTRN